MEKYKNLGGNSNIYAFKIDEKSIAVQFNDGSVYLYNDVRPGTAAVVEMKRLALNGSGLNSYISRVIRKNYYSK
jgi:hypothetical protein